MPGPITVRFAGPLLAATAVFLFPLGLFPFGAFAQTQQLPTAATTASVTADTLTVFAEMSRSSEAVRSLAKGDSVFVDLRIDQGGLKWCGIRMTAQTGRLGFADCKGLVRTSATMVTGGSGAASSALGSGSRSGPVEIPFARPASPTQSGYAVVRAEVVKEGVIDSGYIASAEAQARSGGSAAVTRAALAHYAAAEFELAQHDPDRAIEHLEAMEPFAGQQRELLYACLVGRGYALLLKSEFSAALDPISRARKLIPNAASAATLAGWAHYRLNQSDDALADFQAAQRLAPSASVTSMLEKVKRDKEAEGDFREGASSHFVVRYHGGATRSLASDVTHVLEDQFQSLRNELRYTPPEPIAVILYTQESFRDVTRSPGWAGALNDGKIRVPVQGIETVSDELTRILRHELTHSFVFQKTSGRAPTWLQEGLAQWMEGRRTNGDAAQLVAFYEQGQGKQLRYYDDSWMRFSPGQARYAYAWSLAVVEMIEAQEGSDGVNRLLEAERRESSRETALREGLRMNFSRLDDATVEYLKTTYLQ
ncbi:MAG TPA: basic secretory protein-like protein [Candidatus Eisenbacteria bacterium]|nr:basic secretory protein-like protein [Candidatus Eisenbacteria bacterium]